MKNPTKSPPRTVARSPEKPVMIWDGDCGFCKFWITRWQIWTRGKVEYIRYQDPERDERFPEIPDSDCEKAVQYVDTDGKVYRAAEAVFRSLTHSRWLFWLLLVYQTIPGIRPLSETSYRFVAGNRVVFSWINRILWGTNPEPLRYEQTTNLFIRCIGFIFLIAFFSLWTQVHGLIGENGILPAEQLISNADRYFDQNNAGASRYLKFPTLGWFAAGDGALSCFAILGIVASTLALAGVFPTLSLAVAWLLYLSLARLGQDFLSFQWDALLLETGFLAILIAPWRTRRKSRGTRSRVAGILLVRWLLFRLMLESGFVKLSSGDPTWENLTALNFHFETQPLPTWIGYFTHQFPEILLKVSTIGMFVIELLVPLLIFAPRRLRLFAFFPLVGLQLIIIATGNYGFFNWLTILLCFSLLDDRVVQRAKDVLGKLIHRPPTKLIESSVAKPSLAARIRGGVIAAYAVIAVLIGGLQLLASTGWLVGAPRPVAWINQQIMPFSLINNYGLFAVMTTSRPEIVIEGSVNGNDWVPYEFCYKPGPLNRRPGFILFHMPRLDWQLWFAALSEGNPPRWMQSFCQRLFERSPDVMALLKSDPLDGEQPRYLRVLAYDYAFTTQADDSENWWQAANKRYYLPLLQYQSSSE